MAKVIIKGIQAFTVILIILTKTGTDILVGETLTIGAGVRVAIMADIGVIAAVGSAGKCWSKAT